MKLIIQLTKRARTSSRGLILDSLPSPVLVTDLDGTVQAATDAFLNLVGRGRSELLGKPAPVPHLEVFIASLKRHGTSQTCKAQVFD